MQYRVTFLTKTHVGYECKNHFTYSLLQSHAGNLELTMHWIRFEHHHSHTHEHTKAFLLAFIIGFNPSAEVHPKYEMRATIRRTESPGFLGLNEEVKRFSTVFSAKSFTTFPVRSAEKSAGYSPLSA